MQDAGLHYPRLICKGVNALGSPATRRHAVGSFRLSYYW
jgi:hypothetical protein